MCILLLISVDCWKSKRRNIIYIHSEFNILLHLSCSSLAFGSRVVFVKAHWDRVILWQSLVVIDLQKNEPLISLRHSVIYEVCLYIDSLCSFINQKTYLNLSWFCFFTNSLCEKHFRIDRLCIQLWWKNKLNMHTLRVESHRLWLRPQPSITLIILYTVYR